MAWAFARAADALGVDLIEECEVQGIVTERGAVMGVSTSRGRIAARRVALTGAAESSVLAAMVGMRLPIQSHPLQALVSELLEPVHPCVVLSNTVHVYVSQAHKGELVVGAGMDGYNSYAQRGSFHVIERQIAAALELFPIFAGAHLVRSWAGVVDVSPDASPIIGRTPIEGLFINCGWGTGGYKAIPAGGDTMAHTIAHGRAHPLIEHFGLDRFARGALIDEGAAAGVAH
jgi:sarcosine oxidase subunit beta